LACRVVQCRYFFFDQLSGRSRGYEADGFRSLVKKEPQKYQAERPVRGLTQLGSDRYAFVLDSRDAKSKGYDRLYFDLNHNGDLTDDKPIEAEEAQQAELLPPDFLDPLFSLPALRGFDPRTIPAESSFHQFPPTELTINVDGARTEYAFRFWAVTHAAGMHGAAAMTPGAYRAGDITLDGKNRKVSVLDFNSNGRFDDLVTFRTGVGGTMGPVYPAFGDVLLIVPAMTTTPARPISPLDDEGRQYLSKLVRIDGRFYEAKISPTGDQLTLTPSSAAIGYVSNPNLPFSGTIYGDQGLLPISAEKGNPARVPEGRWKLLSYSIQNAGPRCWLVSARATGDYQEVTVRDGQTVTLPLGPPYRPVVKASETEVIHGGAQVALWMSLVGSCGEMVQSLTVDGQLPRNPELVITDPKGEIVQKGSVEYAGLMERWGGRYSWQVPAGATGDYRARVRIDGGPFQIDDTAESVIHVSGP
jgi:hypothetical protein